MFTLMDGGPNTKIQVQAGIFQDGSTYGDPQWIEGIRKHRVYYLQALDAFLASCALRLQLHLK